MAAPSSYVALNFPIQLRTWTQSRLPTSPSAPVNQYDWPLPTQPVRIEQTWIQFRIPPNVLPLNQKDWPLPPGQVPYRIDATWIETGNNFPPLLNVTLPFRQTDWPLPTPQPYAAWQYTWVDSVPTPGQIPPPVMGRNQYDWPVPRGYPRPDETYVWSVYPGNIPNPFPFNQYNWPVPTANYRIDQTWTVQPDIANIPPPVMGRNQYDWPLPKQPSRLDATWIWFLPESETALPFNQYSWPLPGQPYRIDPTWFESGNNFPPLAAPNPFNQLDWPVPRGYPRPDATWTAFNLLTQRPTVTILPFNQYDWPNPKIPSPIDAYWVNQVPQLTPVPPIIIITAAGKWKDAVIEWKKDSDEKIKAAAAHMSSLGGHARAKALTSKHRSAIASKAASIRWKK